MTENQTNNMFTISNEEGELISLMLYIIQSIAIDAPFAPGYLEKHLMEISDKNSMVNDIRKKLSNSLPKKSKDVYTKHEINVLLNDFDKTELRSCS